jgi:hypothetical protein
MNIQQLFSKHKPKNSKQDVHKKLLAFKKKANERLTNEHKTTKSAYFKKVVNEIIFNEKSQVVANFKEHLIYDDNSEFLKR